MARRDYYARELDPGRAQWRSPNLRLVVAHRSQGHPIIMIALFLSLLSSSLEQLQLFTLVFFVLFSCDQEFAASSAWCAPSWQAAAQRAARSSGRDEPAQSRGGAPATAHATARPLTTLPNPKATAEPKLCSRHRACLAGLTAHAPLHSGLQHAPACLHSESDTLDLWERPSL